MFVLTGSVVICAHSPGDQCQSCSRGIIWQMAPGMSRRTSLAFSMLSQPVRRKLDSEPPFNVIRDLSRSRRDWGKIGNSIQLSRSSAEDDCSYGGSALEVGGRHERPLWVEPPHCWASARRSGIGATSPVAPRPREGRLTEPTAAAQPWPRERVLMPPI